MFEDKKKFRESGYKFIRVISKLNYADAYINEIEVITIGVCAKWIESHLEREHRNLFVNFYDSTASKQQTKLHQTIVLIFFFVKDCNFAKLPYKCVKYFVLSS